LADRDGTPSPRSALAVVVYPALDYGVEIVGHFMN
jgi:hypothetical protein